MENDRKKEVINVCLDHFIANGLSETTTRSLSSALDRLSERYEHYAAELAYKIGCDVDVIAPYMYMGITAVTNYMIFNEEAYILPQLEMIKEQLVKLKKEPA